MTKPRYNGILRPDWRDLRKVLERSPRKFINWSYETVYPTTAIKEKKP